jgi:hypothetical protein
MALPFSVRSASWTNALKFAPNSRPIGGSRTGVRTYLVSGCRDSEGPDAREICPIEGN